MLNTKKPKCVYLTIEQVGNSVKAVLKNINRESGPKIAIAVYVENGGWGSTWAVPIASLMIEKYLTNKITNTDQESFILNGDLIGKK